VECSPLSVEDASITSVEVAEAFRLCCIPVATVDTSFNSDCIALTNMGHLDIAGAVDIVASPSSKLVVVAVDS
jgi:hypothetical protein